MAAADTHAPRAPHQVGPNVWRRADMADESEWTHHLSHDEVGELTEVSSTLVGLDRRAAAALTADDLALPLLGPTLAALRTDLIGGRGFALWRGLPVQELGEARAAAVFVLIGIHLGSLRSQNAAGDLLGHVRNVGLNAADPTVRIYQTDRRQTFHTDSTDVVGLLCLEDAAEGGQSLLVSSAAIYNEMLDRRPDLAAVLFDEVATDRRGEVPDGAEPFFRIPVFTWHEERLTAIYQRQYIDSAERFDNAPRLSDRQVEALDLLDEIANDPTMHLSMDLAPGDIQFVHNHSLLHDRTGFVDRPGSPRHLLRLWLSMPGDRPLPPIFASRYGSVTVGDRGGIVVRDT